MSESNISSIPYHAFGNGSPALHFAHANAYPPMCYQGLLETLGAHYRVLASEQRPLWDPNMEGFRSWAPLVADQIEFIEHNFHQPVTAVGHSLGGVVTTMAAAQRPDLYRCLILLDPVFLTGMKARMLQLIPPSWRGMVHPYISGAMRRRSQWPDRESAIAHFGSKKVFANFSPEAIAHLVDGGLVPNDAGLTLKFSKEWEVRIYQTIECNVWPYLRKVQCPVFGVRGLRSDTLFEDAIRRWRKHPNSRIHEVPHGHLFPMEAPQETAALVTDYARSMAQ